MGMACDGEEAAAGVGCDGVTVEEASGGVGCDGVPVIVSSLRI
jgi:hypothetical protein